MTRTKPDIRQASTAQIHIVTISFNRMALHKIPAAVIEYPAWLATTAPVVRIVQISRIVLKALITAIRNKAQP